MVNWKSVLYLQPLRAISSVGSEHLVYTERVGGSNPSLPTSITILMNFSSGFFVLKKIRSSLYPFFKTKNTPRAQLLRIVFAVAVSTRDMQSLIARINHNPVEFRQSYLFWISFCNFSITFPFLGSWYCVCISFFNFKSHIVCGAILFLKLLSFVQRYGD